MSAATVPKLYRTVIDDVINNVREVFLDDGVDEQVLLELKQIWEKKLMETKAIEHNAKDSDTHVTQIHDNNGQSNQTNNSSSRVNNSTRNIILTRDQNLGTKNHQSQSSQSSQVNSFQSQSNRSTTVHPQPQSQSQSQIQKQLQSSTTAQHLTHSQASPASGSRSLAANSSTTVGPQLNFAPGSMIPQTLFQYTTGEGVDGHKTVTILPQKVTFAFNPQTSGIQTVMSSPATTATLALPPEITASLLHQAAFSTGNVINVTQPQPSVVQHTSNQTNAVNNAATLQFQANSLNPRNVQESARPNQQSRIVQLDGPNDSSDDDDDDDDDFRDNDDDHEDNDDDQNDEDNEYTGEEEEPLNSGDDVSDEDPTELFDTDNVVVCQYDKITRSRNKWKFHLKDGIMNLQGKDYVFQKAIGDAEW